MKLKFKHQRFQAETAKSITEIFKSQLYNSVNYRNKNQTR